MDLKHKTVADRLEECTVTLTIPNCGVGDIAKYTVAATNKWGSEDCSVSTQVSSRRFRKFANFFCRISNNVLFFILRVKIKK